MTAAGRLADDLPHGARTHRPVRRAGGAPAAGRWARRRRGELRLPLSGEPGIGKTRLLADLEQEAGAAGCTVLSGAAAEFERELPFGVFVDAVDEYLEGLDPQTFSRFGADELAELAAVFPAFRSLATAETELGTAAGRFRAHRAVRELIGRLAQRRPVVLILDDLHWADGASLELVEHLLRRPGHAPLLVAGAYRKGQVDGALLDAIARSECGQLELGPLTPEDAETMGVARRAPRPRSVPRRAPRAGSVPRTSCCRAACPRTSGSSC